MKKTIIFGLIFIGNLLLAFDNKMPYFARASGLGEALAALKDDAVGIFYNPAGLNITTVSFSLTDWYFDTRAGAFAGSYNYKDWLTAGAGLVYFSYGQLRYFNEDGIAGNYFSAGFWQAKFSLSKQIHKFISIGTAYKFNYQKIDTVGKSKSNFDVGILSACNIVNLGFYMRDIKNNPGYIGGVTIKAINNLLITADLSYQNELSYMAGIEYFLNPIYLRFGYNSDKNRIATGIGFRQKNYIFDYTISNHQNLGITHQFTISIK
ncbi:MAG: hypothetical protein ABIK33_02200 [candidate division WOR-3 bacterium]